MSDLEESDDFGAFWRYREYLELALGVVDVHAQQYQKQQGNSTAILIRSCKLGTFNPQRNMFLIDREQHLFVARSRFSLATVDQDTSLVDRHSLTTLDRRHPSSVDRHLPFDVDRYFSPNIDRY
ncbi:hypothetical protein F2Q70_00021045 [Brassica cretica]|uniref:Uncharacterized protein n=1 Tax=Brassica cretica TaxID=69181 RepID=A0A8S9GRZ9_BRACR|nr:hypothetical protein F2Q70_00021045 [Brassica cretica]